MCFKNASYFNFLPFKIFPSKLLFGQRMSGAWLGTTGTEPKSSKEVSIFFVLISCISRLCFLEFLESFEGSWKLRFKKKNFIQKSLNRENCSKPWPISAWFPVVLLGSLSLILNSFSMLSCIHVISQKMYASSFSTFFN